MAGASLPSQVSGEGLRVAWVTPAISAGAVLISSAAAAWITHYFTGRTERRRQEHADTQEAAKREHEAKLSHEQRIREQVIATS